MNSVSHPSFDHTATIQSAVNILWSVGFACGYTESELDDIQQRIAMRAPSLTRRVDDAAARDPYRLAYLGMKDLCREHDHWYSLFRYFRLRANQRRYCTQWNWNDRHSGPPRTVSAT
jgi:hypothetical protein